jgi:predicted TIM-barrel fold metal-dependent hydrolase
LRVWIGLLVLHSFTLPECTRHVCDRSEKMTRRLGAIERAHYPLWREAERLGVVFNFYILPHQMPMLEDMTGRFSGMKVVVDHLGEPDLKGPYPWTDFRKMFRLKKFPHVWISASEPDEISLEGVLHRDTWPFFKAVNPLWSAKTRVVL